MRPSIKALAAASAAADARFGDECSVGGGSAIGGGGGGGAVGARAGGDVDGKGGKGGSAEGLDPDLGRPRGCTRFWTCAAASSCVADDTFGSAGPTRAPPRAASTRMLATSASACSCSNRRLSRRLTVSIGRLRRSRPRPDFLEVDLSCCAAAVDGGT